MALKDRIKGILRDIQKKLYPIYAKAKYRIGASERLDPFLTGKIIPDLDTRSKLPAPPIIEPRISSVPTDVQPFSSKFKYDPHIRGFREIKTGLKRDRATYLKAFSDHKEEVLRATIARKNKHLSSKDLQNAIDLVKQRRTELRDIQGDLSIEEYRQRYKDQWEDIKEELGIET